MELLNPQQRRKTVQGIDQIISSFYQQIRINTSLDEIKEVVLIRASELEHLTGLVFDESLAFLTGYQLREMIRNNGTIKVRKSGDYYATHPVCVAAIAKDLAVQDHNPLRDSTTIFTKAVPLALLHDVIEEGERVNGYQDLISASNCPSEIAKSVELLDAPPIAHDYESDLPIELCQYVAFAHLIRKQSPEVCLVELADRLDGLLELEFILQKPLSERSHKLIAALAKWEYMVEQVAEANPAFMFVSEKYHSLKDQVTQQPRCQEVPDLLLEISKIKTSLKLLGEKQASYFDGVIPLYYLERGLTLNKQLQL